MQQNAEEEDLRWTGERLRMKEFDDIMVILKDNFTTGEDHRNNSFQAAETEQQQTFEKNETRRDQKMKDGEARHDELFQRDQEARLKDSEWHANIREQHIQRGRQAREVACQELEKRMAEQFEITLRFLEGSFAAAQLQRQRVVQELKKAQAQSVANERILVRPEIVARDGSQASSRSERRRPEPTPIFPVYISPPPVPVIIATPPPRHHSASNRPPILVRL